MGKNKPEYTPNADTGDYVIVVNCAKLVFTGKKLEDQSLDIPQELEALYKQVSELASLSPLLDNAQQREAIEFVEAASTNCNLNLIGQPEKRAYELLLRLGIFNNIN